MQYNKVTLRDYLAGPETTRPMELAYGIVREPPAPGYEHQMVVGRLFSCLDGHVRGRHAGQVVLSPIDVILDAEGALVVQPDVVFVSAERAAICRDRIWGAPDLVAEVLSAATRRHDSVRKVAWYRRYAVRECWLVDPVSRDVTVHAFDREEPPRRFEGRRLVRSSVLPGLRVRASDLFVQ